MKTDISASVIQHLAIDIQEKVGTLSFREQVTAVIEELKKDYTGIDRVVIARLLRFGK